VSVGLYTGSFDPVHVGHVRLVEEAAQSFAFVVVAVLTNPSKPASGLLPVEERVRLLALATAHVPNVRCVAHAGLAVDAARSHGATTLVRSAHKEHRNELAMAAHNAAVAAIPTTFVTGDPDLGWVSSSVVRRLAADGDWERLAALVPDEVARALQIVTSATQA
jgi:pantetheine-phosphate adenylyltransferase